MSDFKKIISELENAFLQQKYEIDCLKSQLNKDFNDVYDRQAFKIVKKVLYYIEHGIEEKQALFLVYDENDLPFEYVSKIWKIYRPQKSGLLLYGRCYCEHKMKKAGFSTSEIANTLGLSVTTIQKILKQKILMDEIK